MNIKTVSCIVILVVVAVQAQNKKPNKHVKCVTAALKKGEQAGDSKLGEKLALECLKKTEGTIAKTT
jgi:hypothetical protein